MTSSDWRADSPSSEWEQDMCCPLSEVGGRSFAPSFQCIYIHSGIAETQASVFYFVRVFGRLFLH